MWVCVVIPVFYMVIVTWFRMDEVIYGSSEITWILIGDQTEFNIEYNWGVSCVNSIYWIYIPVDSMLFYYILCWLSNGYAIELETTIGYWGWLNVMNGY